MTGCNCFVKYDLSNSMVVLNVFGVNYVVARFVRVVIFCDCILDFEPSGSMMLLVNGLEISIHYRKHC